jgi:dipeptidyl aminopeptidase/acylaminoacyl peptidase
MNARSLPGARRLAVLLYLLASAANSQGTAADYQRAVGLRERYQGLVVDAPEPPTWIENTNRFWYRKSIRGGSQIVVVDATTLEKRPALPSENFGASTGAAGGGRGGAGGGGRGGAQPGDTMRVSPDGRLVALIRNYNVWLRPSGASDAVPLSTDGSEGDPFTLQSIAWSPDSRRLAAYRVRPGYRRMVRYVESSPPDQIQPKTFERFYAKPGDVLDLQQPSLFDVEKKTEIAIDNALFPNPYELSRIAWRKDGRAFTFEYNERGHQLYRVIEADAATGSTRAIITERANTFIDYRRTNGGLSDSGRQYRFDLGDGKETIWMSERDGWAHLYLYDGVTGAVKNQITRGNWLVRGVQRVDEATRQIWFSAGGMNPKQDPYFAQYYRINFDGTGLTPLTDTDGDHMVSFSSDGQFYVDTWSRVDLPPVSQLRRASDAKVLLDLERGDASELVKAGWRAPEVFVAKGRDGSTDIWGVIVRPSNFDPRRKYPVLENIYAGPQGSFVPKTFAAYNAMQGLAELGFIVVQIDGMGTANRSKTFHDVAWKNLGDAGFPDRILWHKAVGARYPYYDLSRVGIYGGSAGGQSSLGALLFHPEFYRVAVSFAGCHDNRMDKVWWNELWMGWPIGPEYAASSNVDNAWRLQGKLLLVVGELDTNVDPSSTLQVVNALIKANKTFEMLVFPGEDHPAGRRGPSAPYGDRKLYDFFVHNLLGVEPPAWNTGPSLRSAGGDDGSELFGPGWESVRASWTGGRP